jgi:hypothetical protein
VSVVAPGRCRGAVPPNFIPWPQNTVPIEKQWNLINLFSLILELSGS